MCVCVIMAKLLQERPILEGTTTEAALSALPGVFMSVDRFSQCDGISTVQDAVLKLQLCALEIITKTQFETGVGNLF